MWAANATVEHLFQISVAEAEHADFGDTKKTEIPRIQFIVAPTAGFRKKGMRLIRLILSRQIRVPFWKATPANAASPAVGITSRYKIPEKCPIDGITNAGLSPKKIWQTKVAVTDAISTWARKPRLFRSSMISSRMEHPSCASGLDCDRWDTHTGGHSADGPGKEWEIWRRRVRSSAPKRNRRSSARAQALLTLAALLGPTTARLIAVKGQSRTNDLPESLFRRFYASSFNQNAPGRVRLRLRERV